MGCYHAHAVKVTESTMKIKIHGGPVITLPIIAGIDEKTQLVVQRKPGTDKVDRVWTLQEYRLMFELPTIDTMDTTVDAKYDDAAIDYSAAWVLPPVGETDERCWNIPLWK